MYLLLLPKLNGTQQEFYQASFICSHIFTTNVSFLKKWPFSRWEFWEKIYFTYTCTRVFLKWSRRLEIIGLEHFSLCSSQFYDYLVWKASFINTLSNLKCQLSAINLLTWGLYQNNLQHKFLSLDTRTLSGTFWCVPLISVGIYLINALTLVYP